MSNLSKWNKICPAHYLNIFNVEFYSETSRYNGMFWNIWYRNRPIISPNFDSFLLIVFSLYSLPIVLWSRLFLWVNSGYFMILIICYIINLLVLMLSYWLMTLPSGLKILLKKIEIVNDWDIGKAHLKARRPFANIHTVVTIFYCQ